jgi:hypothetical protein
MKIPNLDRTKVIIAVISLALFVTSLTQVAFIVDDYNGKGVYSSIEVFVVGATAVLGGGLLESFIWLANPLYLFSMFLFISGNRSALKISCIASLIASSFSLWHEVLVCENGRNAPITSLNAGYYLWLSSLCVMMIGIFVYSEFLEKKRI